MKVIDDYLSKVEMIWWKLDGGGAEKNESIKNQKVTKKIQRKDKAYHPI